MKKSPATSSEITLFNDGMDVLSSDPKLNITPPHGKTVNERVIRSDNDESCFNVETFKFCYENVWLNTRLKMYVIIGDQRIDAKPIGGSFSDILYRFIGSPPASLHAIIRFEKEVYGLLHKYGFTLFRNGVFCQSIRTNPNGRIALGMDAQGTPLIFTSGSWTSVDTPVDGWREYEISRLCQ